MHWVGFRTGSRLRYGFVIVIASGARACAGSGIWTLDVSLCVIFDARCILDVCGLIRNQTRS